MSQSFNKIYEDMDTSMLSCFFLTHGVHIGRSTACKSETTMYTHTMKGCSVIPTVKSVAFIDG